jgi:hypothetical protein
MTAVGPGLVENRYQVQELNPTLTINRSDLEQMMMGPGTEAKGVKLAHAKDYEAVPRQTIAE